MKFYPRLFAILFAFSFLHPLMGQQLPSLKITFDEPHMRDELTYPYPPDATVNGERRQQLFMNGARFRGGRLFNPGGGVFYISDWYCWDCFGGVITIEIPPKSTNVTLAVGGEGSGNSGCAQDVEIWDGYFSDWGPAQPAKVLKHGCPGGNWEYLFTPVTLPVVNSGLISIVMSENPWSRRRDGQIWIDNVEYMPPPPPPPPPTPPQFTFLLTGIAQANPEQARLLTHKYNSADSFFSKYQLAAPNLVPPTATRPQMSIEGVVANAPSKNEIWFKVVDPPDEANYVPPGDAFEGDNLDPQPPILRSADGAQVTPLGGTPLKESWDASMHVKIILEGSDHASGDNYKIIASFGAPDENGFFACTPDKPCFTSPVLTTWKRVTLDSYAMFRRGAFLAASIATGDKEILVRGGKPPFAPGDSLILLGHGQTTEPVTIDAHPVDANGDALLPIEKVDSQVWRVRLTTPVTHDYVGVPTNLPSFGADAVGIAGSYFIADSGSLKDFFSSMSVDVVTPVTLKPFPYWAVLPNPQTGNATETVLANFFLSPSHANALRLIGARRIPAYPTQTGCTTFFGHTTHQKYSLFNYSYVYVDNIDAATSGILAPCTKPFPHLSGRSAAAVTRAAAAHEITHQFGVNPLSPAGGGHCDRIATVPPGVQGDLCLMNATWPADAQNASQLDQPRLAFHWILHGMDSEYTQVRSCPEPVNH